MPQAYHMPAAFLLMAANYMEHLIERGIRTPHIIPAPTRGEWEFHFRQFPEWRALTYAKE